MAVARNINPTVFYCRVSLKACHVCVFVHLYVSGMCAPQARQVSCPSGSYSSVTYSVYVCILRHTLSYQEIHTLKICLLFINARIFQFLYRDIHIIIESPSIKDFVQLYPIFVNHSMWELWRFILIAGNKITLS